MSCKANELGDVGVGSGKSYLFFLTTYYPGISLAGERVTRLEKHLTSEVSGALSSALENPRESIIHSPGRTNNRIRSPRLKASSQ